MVSRNALAKSLTSTNGKPNFGIAKKSPLSPLKSKSPLVKWCLCIGGPNTIPGHIIVS